jgi:hypothetical protein
LRGVCWMLKWHLPTPMPTSTINPREISDTISLFTEIGQGIRQISTR